MGDRKVLMPSWFLCQTCNYGREWDLSWTSSERLMYVQFTSCVQREVFSEALQSGIIGTKVELLFILWGPETKLSRNISSDDFSVAFWTSSLKSALVAISLVKVRIKKFQFTTWPHVDHIVQGKSAHCLVWYLWVFCKWYFLICHVILRDYVIKGSCNFKGGSLSRLVITLPSLVAIDIAVARI